jgi:isopenicillin-N epimerase
VETMPPDPAQRIESEQQVLRELFLLRPDIVFLNHGSFGACARPVFAAYQKW